MAQHIRIAVLAVLLLGATIRAATGAAGQVSLDEAAGKLGMTLEPSPTGSSSSLVGHGHRVEIPSEGREISVDGIRVFLGDPVGMRGGSACVSETDFKCCLLPRLRPDLLANAPHSPKVIALDPGHGGTDSGTQNERLGYMEKTFTLDTAVRLKKLLEADGYRVVLTRDGDFDVPKPMRAEKANLGGADLFISIHFNALPDAKTHGSEIFSLAPRLQNSSDSWGKGEKDALAEAQPGNANDGWNTVLAHAVFGQVLDSLHTADRGEKIMHLAVLRPLNCPGILLESAFLSNDEEARKVATPEFRQQIAESIMAGIKAYRAIIDGLRPAVQNPGNSSPKRP